jgi:phenylacetate-CoA ligase
MPLVRYEIGDSAARLEGPCGCGSSWTTFRQIIGRVDDVIVTPDGRRVGRIDHIFKGLHGIRECQVIQETARLIRLKIVMSGEFDQETQLLENIRERLGPAMQVELERVERIPRTSSGKFRSVINRAYPSDRSEVPVSAEGESSR